MATMFEFGFIDENLLYLNVFGQNWIIPLIISMLVVLLVTRNPNKFGAVFLPSIMSLQLLGLYISLPMWIVSVTLGGFLFVSNALGTEVMGSMVRGGLTDIGARARSEKGLFSKASRKTRISNLDLAKSERLHRDRGIPTTPKKTKISHLRKDEYYHTPILKEAPLKKKKKKTHDDPHVEPTYNMSFDIGQTPRERQLILR